MSKGIVCNKIEGSETCWQFQVNKAGEKTYNELKKESCMIENTLNVFSEIKTNRELTLKENVRNIEI